MPPLCSLPSATALACFLFAILSCSGAVALHDTFSTGTDGWAVGPRSRVQPSQERNGGPGGQSDGYLFAQALGTNGPGGRLVVLNEAQWQGNFMALGITAVGLDVRNLSSAPLTLRLAFEGVTLGNAVHRVVTSATFSLAAYSQWQHVRFSIEPDDLIGDGVSSDPQIALQNVTQTRLLHNPLPEFRGAIVSAALGIDNIQAIPEPRAIWLVILCLAAAATRRRRRLPVRFTTHL